MQEFLQKIRTHFNVIHQEDSLSLTLINPNLDLDIIKEIKSTFRLMHHIKKQQIIIIQSVTFDDQLLEELADALPESLEEISLDFTGCQSLRGTAFTHLFQRLSSMPLKKLKLDLSQVYDVNDLVIEGLSLLLQELSDLQEFYLDLYQVDQITEEGYLLLAESITSLQNLHSLHLDFSANPNLTQDNLELFFMNIPAERLKRFEFRILDIDHIGGGSFFTLGDKLSKMKQLQLLNITISTFSNLNSKGIYSILKEITYLQKLTELTLNLSDIHLPNKILSYLNLPSLVSVFNLDISCNKQLTDSDILTLIKNVKNISKLSLNLDFCFNVTQDSLQELVQILLKNGKCAELALPDKKYSSQFLQFVMKNSFNSETLLKCQINQINQLSSATKNQWQKFQQFLSKKRNNIQLIIDCQQKKMSPASINSILSVMN